MPPSILSLPPTDPTPLFDLFRGNLATELLTAAVVHLRVFEHLAAGPVAGEALRRRLGLEARPSMVLFTALRAMGLLSEHQPGLLDLTPLARHHLVGTNPFDISGYIGVAGDSPGVLAMVERLRANKPANTEPEQKGAAFIYREGLESAMEQEAAARHLTLALAGRARICAPVLAQRILLPDMRLVLDVGGGTGVYSIALLQQNPVLRAIVWDRPEVLKVAEEFAHAHGVSERLECRPGDMFTDAVPAGVDVVLLSNVLHDWDVPESLKLLERCAGALPRHGRVLIHDVFLNDALDGPLPLALYSAALFFLTEGRAYSAAEYRSWLTQVGLTPGEIVPTLVHCGVLPAIRNS
jgi:SAM-dependent methyltransferase